MDFEELNLDDLKFFKPNPLERFSSYPPHISITKDGIFRLNGKFCREILKCISTVKYFFKFCYSKSNNAIGLLRIYEKQMKKNKYYNWGVYKLHSLSKSGGGNIKPKSIFFESNDLDINEIAGKYEPKLISTKHGDIWFLFLNEKLEKKRKERKENRLKPGNEMKIINKSFEEIPDIEK